MDLFAPLDEFAGPEAFEGGLILLVCRNQTEVHGNTHVRNKHEEVTG
jgi:hypothetical protein